MSLLFFYFLAMDIKLKYLWCTIALIAFFILGYVFRGCDDRHKAETVTVTHTDTLTVRDTIVERQPVFVTIDRVDTMLIAIRDTVTIRDTSYIVIDREQRHYKGDDYEAWVSGYRPALRGVAKKVGAGHSGRHRSDDTGRQNHGSALSGSGGQLQHHKMVG